MFGHRNEERIEQPKQETYHAWEEGDVPVHTDSSGHEYEWYQAMQQVWKEEKELEQIKYNEVRRKAFGK